MAAINGKKLIIRWHSERDATDYYRLYIDVEIDIHINADVTPKSSKKKIEDVEINIVIIPILVRDYEERWSGSPLTDFLREFFDKFVSKSKLKEMESTLASEALALRNELNAFFNIKKG